MPYFGYSRQDKKSELREPISARLVAHMLEAAGVDRVVAVDLHAGQIQGFFTKPLDHATAMLPARATTSTTCSSTTWSWSRPTSAA